VTSPLWIGFKSPGPPKHQKIRKAGVRLGGLCTADILRITIQGAKVDCEVQLEVELESKRNLV
jgi:hypothetical protein